MSLIKCPECGKEISDRASNCPSCGCPIKSEFLGEKKKSKIIVVAVVCLVCAVIGSVVFLGISNENKKEKYYNQALEYYQSDKLMEAREVLERIPNYDGVDELRKKVAEREEELEREKVIKDYELAIDTFQQGFFGDAIAILNGLPENVEIEGETIEISSVITQINQYEKIIEQLVSFRGTLKNPDSLEIKAIYYSPISDTLDKDVLFITYKATNSFGGYLEKTACIQDGIYIGEQYKDLGLAKALLAHDQRQEMNSVVVQNALNIK